jgi:hypothetical protein
MKNIEDKTHATVTRPLNTSHMGNMGDAAQMSLPGSYLKFNRLPRDKKKKLSL